MSSIAKIVLPVALLSAVAGGAYFLLGGDSGPTKPPSDTHPTEENRDKKPEAQPIKPAVATEAQPQSQDPANNRRVANVPGEAHSDAPQGVRGKVLKPNGEPAAALEVYLMEAATTDPLKVFIAQRTGQKFSPASKGLTAQDGSFALGVTTPGQAFDLRVVSTDYPELQFGGIRVRDSEWFDAGMLTLKMGVVVQGHVTMEGQGTAISGATVYMSAPNANFQALPTPGREKGVMVQTDSTGFYRFTTAPSDGLVTITAEAPEYASGERANFQPKTTELNEVNLELARGLPISGFVVDSGGKPVANAQLVATALSAKMPLSVSLRTQPDGAFTTPTLREGPYRMVITAGGFEEKTQQAMSGENNVKIVMEQRGQVKLRVLSARGMPVKAYTLALRRYFANNPGAIGKVMDYSDKRITPADYEGEWAIVPNIPVGEFVFQITDNDHAKTLTPPFQVAANMQQPPQVEVTLTMGAGVTGTVLDDTGAPVANATVTTDMNGGFAAEGGFFDIFKPFLPDKHTISQTKTDNMGRFKLTKLAFSEYMLRVSHPNFCEGVSLDIKLDTDGQLTDIGAVTLMQGTIIEGRCLLGGEPAGQVKVQIGPPENAKPQVDAQGKPKQFFAVSALTDNDGYYKMLKRVPPGTYKIHASRQAGNNDIFTPLLHMKATQRDLVITPGMPQSTQNFDLPAQ